MSEINAEKVVVDYKARAKKAWQTRRTNKAKAKNFFDKAKILPPVGGKKRRKRGRPKKNDLKDGLKLSSAIFTFEQVRELKAVAVTTDGTNYRLLTRKGSLLPVSFFE